jgi:hypothetical protein
VEELQARVWLGVTVSTRKVKKGEAWRPDSSDDHNIKGLAADAYRRGETFTPDREHQADPCRIWLKNTSGTLRRQFECLELDDEIILSQIQAHQLYFDGIVSTDTGIPFAVLLQPAGINKWRQAQVSGICPALVDVVSTSHTRAYLPSGEYVLKSIDEGPVAIAQRPASTGEQTCVISFHAAPVKQYGFSPVGGIAAATLATGQITPGSATVTIWRLVSGKYESTARTVTVYNPWPDAIVAERFISFSRDVNGLLTIDAEACNAFE